MGGANWRAGLAEVGDEPAQSDGPCAFFGSSRTHGALSNQEKSTRNSVHEMRDSRLSNWSAVDRLRTAGSAASFIGTGRVRQVVESMAADVKNSWTMLLTQLGFLERRTCWRAARVSDVATSDSGPNHPLQTRKQQRETRECTQLRYSQSTVGPPLITALSHPARGTVPHTLTARPARRSRPRWAPAERPAVRARAYPPLPHS